MIASYPVLVLSALDKRQKFAYAELKIIRRPCYSVYSRLQSLRCLWSCGLNLVPMTFPGHANEVDEVGETLVTLWILWRLLIGREWRSTFSMTSAKIFHCTKCESFLQLRVKIKIFVNYALKHKQWTILLDFLTNTYRWGIQEAFSLRSRVRTDQGDSNSESQQSKVIKRLQTFRFFSILLQWRIIFNPGLDRKVFFLDKNSVVNFFNTQIGCLKLSRFKRKTPACFKDFSSLVRST